MSRLASTLQILGRNDSTWLRFLTFTNSVDWPRVYLSGHSQGGSHAAWVAFKYKLARAIIFSGPEDTCGTHSWTIGFRPTREVFGVAHFQEDDINTIQDNWKQMGIEWRGDEATAVLVKLPPKGMVLKASSTGSAASHFAGLDGWGTACGGRSAQCSTLLDEFTPNTVEGTAAYAPLWKAMLREETQTLQGPTDCPDGIFLSWR